MAYGTIYSDTIQGSTANTAPVFNDGNSREIGQLTKVWVNFNTLTTTSARASFNVSSLTDNGTGDTTISFTNLLSDVNYSALGTGGHTSAVATSDMRLVTMSNNGSRTTSACRLATSYANGAGGYDLDNVNVAIFR
mgnify:FL=1